MKIKLMYLKSQVQSLLLRVLEIEVCKLKWSYYSLNIIFLNNRHARAFQFVKQIRSLLRNTGNLIHMFYNFVAISCLMNVSIAKLHTRWKHHYDFRLNTSTNNSHLYNDFVPLLHHAYHVFVEICDIRIKDGSNFKSKNR